MYKIFDIENWNRKETYFHFKDFDFPFFNVCLNIDITNVYKKCKTEKHSINLALHFCSLLALNEITEFKLRIKDDQIVLFEKVDGGATILLENNSIRYCLYEFSESYDLFSKTAFQNEESIRQKAVSDSRTKKIDIVHFSVLPWIAFTSISHAHTNLSTDSIPKIVFGKYFENAGKLLIPISVEVNHSLIDGWHINEFILKLQQKLAAFSTNKHWQ